MEFFPLLIFYELDFSAKILIEVKYLYPFHVV